MIGLERIHTMTSEDVSQIEICAVVEHQKKIDTSFNVEFTFTPDSASMCFITL